MMQLSSKMMTHHFVMTLSLLIKILIIDKFGDFSCHIDESSRTDVFREVFSHIINQSAPRRPQGASGGHKVSASRTAQASEACLLSINWTNLWGYMIIFKLNILLDDE